MKTNYIQRTAYNNTVNLRKWDFLQDGSGGGIVQTESVVYSGDPTVTRVSTTQVPIVATEARKVQLESDDGNYTATGEIVSSQTISSKTRTVETITVSYIKVIFSNFKTVWRGDTSNLSKNYI